MILKIHLLSGKSSSNSG